MMPATIVRLLLPAAGPVVRHRKRDRDWSSRGSPPVPAVPTVPVTGCQRRTGTPIHDCGAPRRVPGPSGAVCRTNGPSDQVRGVVECCGDMAHRKARARALTLPAWSCCCRCPVSRYLHDLRSYAMRYQIMENERAATTEVRFYFSSKKIGVATP